EPPSHAWLGWTSAGLGTLLAGTLLFMLAKRRRRGPSPADWALGSIADLEAISIENETDAGAVINEVVDIVREFFELQYNIPGLSITSRQFKAQAAKQAGLTGPAQEALAWLVSLADEIKFARFDVGAQQSRQAIERSKALIEECQRRRQASETGAA
ncbi:MAG TPA: hypothetical protein VHE81_22730, partial [Lacipirellulaceae bacterium]|nr:hypothetical protein [Lacipirellulaceae bacterium]